MSVAATASDPVTARWTGALFNLARRSGALEDVRRDMQRLGTELESRAVRDFLVGGRQATAARLAKLDGLLSSFHPLSKNFVRLLFERRREEVLPGVSEAFRRRMLEERGAVEGVVESARAIGSADLARLATALSAKLGVEVLLRNRVVPELVGGVRVIVGTKMIDQSVQGRLDSLRRRLQETRLPALSH